MHADPYATGVLFKEHHDRLVAGLDAFARDAGIQPHWVWTRLADTCGEDERDYVRRFHHHRARNTVQGLCYVRATPNADPADRMAAVAGALLRNFIRARVMTVGTVLAGLSKGDDPEATCLLIPNFFLSKAEGGTLATWQVQALYDLLVRRGTTGTQTILYATDLKTLGTEYGAAFRRLVEQRYIIVEI